MTSMSGDVPNERWEGDLEADQLDDLAAREDVDVAPDALGARGAADPIGAPPAGRESAVAPPDARVPNERWENDLEASDLDTEAAEEGADEKGDGLM